MKRKEKRELLRTDYPFALVGCPIEPVSTRDPVCVHERCSNGWNRSRTKDKEEFLFQSSMDVDRQVKSRLEMKNGSDVVRLPCTTLGEERKISRRGVLALPCLRISI